MVSAMTVDPPLSWLIRASCAGPLVVAGPPCSIYEFDLDHVVVALLATTLA